MLDPRYWVRVESRSIQGHKHRIVQFFVKDQVSSIKYLDYWGVILLQRSEYLPWGQAHSS